MGVCGTLYHRVALDILTSVTLPRRSSTDVFFRQAVRHFISLLSISSEPLRSRARATALRKSAARGVRPPNEAFPPTVVLMVYRARNVPLVQMLLSQIDSRADVRLWALDAIAPELADLTLGSGPGVRFSHLNHLYSSRPIPEGSWVILADDDVFFVQGDLEKMIDMMKRADLSLAQPGQSMLGWWNFFFTVSRPFLHARDANYVEQGPLIVADPSFAKLILPFPENEDMGWGIEAQWYRIKDKRFRIGIIDSCRVIHQDRAARSYQAAPQMRRMQERLLNSGMHSIWQLQSVNARWWRWQSAPSWKAR